MLDKKHVLNTYEIVVTQSIGDVTPADSSDTSPGDRNQ